MKNIINYDAQGFPIHKISLKDIISTFMNYNPVDKAYWIKEDDPKLQLFPRVLENDGMGYGINEKKICSFSFVNDTYINVFVETSLPENKIVLWERSQFYPGIWTKGEGTSKYFIKDIEEKDGQLVYICDKYKKTKSGDFKKCKQVLKFENELNYV